MNICSDFPKFWESFEDDSDDLVPAKSLLTVLGYRTKSSISAINSNTKIKHLDNEYARMKSLKSVEMIAQYPSLAHIDFITPGLKEIILGIAARLSPQKDIEDVEAQIKSNILRLASKVSHHRHIL